jgi:gamma-glutamyltranspeptidase
MIVRMVEYGQNLQAASGTPRWRPLGGRQVAVEPNFAPTVPADLTSRGQR